MKACLVHSYACLQVLLSTAHIPALSPSVSISEYTQHCAQQGAELDPVREVSADDYFLDDQMSTAFDSWWTPPGTPLAGDSMHQEMLSSDMQGASLFTTFPFSQETGEDGVSFLPLYSRVECVHA